MRVEKGQRFSRLNRLDPQRDATQLHGHPVSVDTTNTCTRNISQRVTKVLCRGRSTGSYSRKSRCDSSRTGQQEVAGAARRGGRRGGGGARRGGGRGGRH